MRRVVDEPILPVSRRGNAFAAEQGARALVGPGNDHEHAAGEARLVRPAQTVEDVDPTFPFQQPAVSLRNVEFGQFDGAGQRRVEVRPVGHEAGRIGHKRHLAIIWNGALRQAGQRFGARLDGGRPVLPQRPQAGNGRRGDSLAGPRDVVARGIIDVVVLARFTGTDHRQAKGSCPAHEPDQQRRLVAFDQRIRHACGSGLSGEHGADDALGLLRHHGDAAPCLDRRQRMARARLRVSGCLHHHVQRQRDEVGNIGADRDLAGGQSSAAGFRTVAAACGDPHGAE